MPPMSPTPPIDQVLRSALRSTLDSTDLDALGRKYEGKVRDNYSTSDGRRIIVVTDRISAFDRVIGTLALQGAGLESHGGVVVREDGDPRAEPRARRARSERARGRRMRAAPRRDGGARLLDRRDVDEHLDALRSAASASSAATSSRTACARTSGSRRRFSRPAPRPRRAITTSRRRAPRSWRWGA